jgi:hypothetical protein
MKEPRPNSRFALCVENVVIPDEDAEKEGYFRVVDESGEDYLYPASHFILVELPAEAQEAMRPAS